MPETRIANASASDINSAFTTGTENFYSVDPQNTDGVGEQKETTWNIKKWTQYLGYYKQIPELRAVIDARATWTVGKGYKADSRTEAQLVFIKGGGVDTFNTILENMIRTMQIAGDSFAEIIRDGEGNLINLKPLDPSTVKIVANQKGIIIRYELISKTKKKNERKDPSTIFHLIRNRVADEIHGVSLIEALEETILAKNEAMTDWRRVMHRNVDPMMIYHLDTDDETEIAAFKSKVDAAKGKGENMYVPKDAVVPEQLAIAPNAALNPLPWIAALTKQFYQIAGVPQIVLGGSEEFTEANAKIAYLAFQQSVEEEQLYIEEQLLEQIYLTIELDFPASLENEMLSDQKKDGMESQNPNGFQKNETTAGGKQ